MRGGRQPSMPPSELNPPSVRVELDGDTVRESGCDGGCEAAWDGGCVGGCDGEATAGENCQPPPGRCIGDGSWSMRSEAGGCGVGPSTGVCSGVTAAELSTEPSCCGVTGCNGV